MKKRRYASLCTKRREGVFAFGSKDKSFVHKQSNLQMEEKVKIYYKVWTNIQSNVQFLITMSFTEIIQMPLKIYAGKPSAIYEMCFGLLTFSIVILYTTKQYKVKSNYKRVSNTYRYRTGLSKLRASSLANSRPPFAQIYVINLLPMLRALLGMSTKSDGDRLKFGLFTIFDCVQPAFRNAPAVPREVSRAQKSSCPAITSSSACTSPSMCSKVLDMFSAEGVNFSALAPTELKTFFNRYTQRLPKSRHMFQSSFKDCCSFVFPAASASYFMCKLFLSCSKLSHFCRSSMFNLAFSACSSQGNLPLLGVGNLSFQEKIRIL
jgi:hypothetical protein